MAATDRQSNSDHLCVLVHGLWGNPSHLKSLATALQEKHGEDELHVLVSKSNSDTFTYDGIDVGGERVAQEIEKEVERIEEAGTKITKLSVVGYSMGGLIARYAIGLLYSRGWFDRLKPINFNAFASPFIGTRAPLRGYHSSLWNAIASRTVSTSGSQLFLTDSFRDTGRPLLSVLADPNSIFMRALALFKNRVLYANIQNDRSAPYFTTYITSKDPYEDLSAINLNHVKGYGTVICNPDKPFSIKKDDPDLYTRVAAGTSAVVGALPFYAAFTILAPVFTAGFLVNSGIQSLRSSKRVKLHNEGGAGLGYLSYRIPLMIEGALDSMNAHETPEHLPSDDPNSEKGVKPVQRGAANAEDEADIPTLALAPEQFEMIEALDKVGFKKYPVHISRVRHSHAAIIHRINRYGHQEGFEVLRHWLDNEFEL